MLPLWHQLEAPRNNYILVVLTLVQTNIWKLFLNLIDKHFKKSDEYYKIFNSKCIKIIYSCSPNIKALINSHNKRILNKPLTDADPCNYRKKTDCPSEINASQKTPSTKPKLHLKNVTPKSTLDPRAGLSKPGSMSTRTPSQNLTSPSHPTAPN